MAEKKEWVETVALLIQAAQQAGIKGINATRLAWWATNKEMAKAAIAAFATGEMK